MYLVVIKLFKTILTMELIRARRVTLQICILYKPEKSVISLSANLGLERRWIRGKTRDYFVSCAESKRRQNGSKLGTRDKFATHLR